MGPSSAGMEITKMETSVLFPLKKSRQKLHFSVGHPGPLWGDVQRGSLKEHHQGGMGEGTTPTGWHLGRLCGSLPARHHF